MKRIERVRGIDSRDKAESIRRHFNYYYPNAKVIIRQEYSYVVEVYE